MTTPQQIEDYLLSSTPLPADVEAAGPSNESNGPGGAAIPLYDWWGSMHDVRRRGPERLSIIFAFDDPK